jgi:tRNA(His) guanylyltransferase
MDNDAFEALQRRREWFHGFRLLPGSWAIVRVDGRSFSAFTERRFDKPFDERFSSFMVTAAEALVTELEGVYAYTESDEISLLLAPQWELFDRSVEKLVSIAAGIASATFTHVCGEPAHFDARVWLGTSVDDVVDYFSWRQADASRCALNGWCYWTLRSEGQSVAEVTKALHRASVRDKNELLFARDINFNEVPTWQRRGIGIWWETYEREGVNPVTGLAVPVARRRLRVERALPMRDEYRNLVSSLLTPTTTARSAGTRGVPEW